MNENVLSGGSAAYVYVCAFLSMSLPFHTVQVCVGIYCDTTGLIGPSSCCQLPAL